MRQAGRANLLMILGIVSLLVLVGIFLLAPKSPRENATRFMDALAKGNVATLTELSYMPKLSKEEIQAKWQKTVDYGKHYLFIYKIGDAFVTNETQATVRMEVTRNALRQGAYGEKFELPMVKDQNEWKVDVLSLNRDLYPGLPR